MISEIGKPTKKLTVNAISQIFQKSDPNPTFIMVSTRDMKNDMAMDTKVPNKRV